MSAFTPFNTWAGYTGLGTGAAARTYLGKAQEIPSIEDYSTSGGVGAQIQRAITANYGKELLARASTYEVDTPVDITSTITLRGYGKTLTSFNRAFNPSADSQGIFNITATADSVKITDCGLFSKAGQNAGCLIAVLASASDNPSACSLWNLWMSTQSTDTHKYTLYIDGSLKTGAPVGIRDFNIFGCDIFGGITAAALIKSVVRFGMYGGGVTVAGGSNGHIELTGTASVGSTNVTIEMPVLNSGLDALSLDRTSAAVFLIGNLGNVINTANVDSCTVIAGLHGTIQNNWTNSQVFGSNAMRLGGTQFFAGAGAPAAGLGSNGDFYFRSGGTVGGNTVVYHKEAGSWTTFTTT